MRAVVTVLIFALATTAAAQPYRAWYGNARFGFRISYPPDLIPQPESANGDGRVFRSADGRVEARAWGSNDAGFTPAQLADMAQEDCVGPPAYRRVAASFFAISCNLAEGRILYQKTLFGHGGAAAGFSITYPAADKARWEPVLIRMGGSLRAP